MGPVVRTSAGLVAGLLLFAPPHHLDAQERPVADITVSAGAIERNNLPVSATINGVSLQTYPNGLKLYEIRANNQTVAVPVQIRPGDSQQISWILTGRTPANSTRRYQLRVNTDTAAAAAPRLASGVRVEDTGTNLNITIAGKSVLSYRYTPQPVPEGVNAVFSASGFIHPLQSPKGTVITRIQAPDHWHHYGLWNPWTHTTFEGRSVDFWNIGSRQGRWRATGVLAKTSGNVFGGFRTAHESVDYTSGTEKVAMKEVIDVTVWAASADQSVWVVDWATTMSPATDSALRIDAYRYQGFGMRATPRWNDANSTFITSAGKNKSDANGTRARWMNLAGPADDGTGAQTSGVLFFTTPTNYNFPEELRIWPTGQNRGVENVFVNFNPAQTRDWLLEPGQTYTLRYRFLVYDGQMATAQAETEWQSYANPPQVDVRVINSLQ